MHSCSFRESNKLFLCYCELGDKHIFSCHHQPCPSHMVLPPKTIVGCLDWCWCADSKMDHFHDRNPPTFSMTAAPLTVARDLSSEGVNTYGHPIAKLAGMGNSMRAVCHVNSFRFVGIKHGVVATIHDLTNVVVRGILVKGYSVHDLVP